MRATPTEVDVNPALAMAASEHLRMAMLSMPEGVQTQEALSALFLMIFILQGPEQFSPEQARDFIRAGGEWSSMYLMTPEGKVQ